MILSLYLIKKSQKITHEKGLKKLSKNPNSQTNPQYQFIKPSKTDTIQLD